MSYYKNNKLDYDTFSIGLTINSLIIAYNFPILNDYYVGCIFNLIIQVIFLSI